ncbi:hypothetical protein MKX01_025426 [Papaver californicum]|nr:hypothetical protein MKX01_025426 [Papaver californicum]
MISDSEIAKEFSHHKSGIARINNGSFGSCPLSILAIQQEWQKLIKEYVNADHVEEISNVDNATTAVAIVLRQICWAFSEGNFQKGDAVVMLHYAYGAVKKSIHAYVETAGGYVIEARLPFPIKSNNEIISEFRKALKIAKCDGRKIRLAVIDHITSMPSVVIPIKELVKICREENVEQIFVDGAHAIGCVDVDMKEIGADFYTSNLHKWLFCPPSVAFLYCRKGSRAELHHPVVSSEYGNGLAIESGWIGNRDYSSQLVVPSVLDFVNRFEGGIEGIKKRNHDAVIEMGEMLAKAWGTYLGSPPDILGISNELDALKLRTHLRDRFHVEVPLHCEEVNHGEIGNQNQDGSLITGYARISHQVYNNVDDYEKFRDAIIQLVRDGFTCSMLYPS